MSDEKKKTIFTLKFERKNVDPEIVEFANIQKNFNDTIRYLIQKEIAENGIRNFQEFIPSERDKKYFEKFKKTKDNEENTNKMKIEKSSLDKDKVGLEISKSKDKKLEIPNCYI